MRPEPTKFVKYEPGRKGERSRNVIVRLAQLHDAPAIAEIALERDGGTFEEHRDGAAGEIECQGSNDSRWLVLVAEADGKIAGFGRVKYLMMSDGSASLDLPEGWYLNGLIVAPEFQRLGIGLRLSERRISWVAERADIVRYFASLQNRASIALHKKLGFKEVKRGIVHPRIEFRGGVGALFELPLVQER